MSKLGNLVGCLVAACYGNRLGRKNTLRVGALISAIGAVLQFSAYSFPQLIIGRVINGMGNGSFLAYFRILLLLTSAISQASPVQRVESSKPSPVAVTVAESYPSLWSFIMSYSIARQRG